MVNDTYGIMQVRPCFLVASGECMIWHMVNDTYGITQVRLHLPVAFRVCMYWRMTNFVRGGCMLFPAAHMVNDTYGKAPFFLI